MPQSKQRLYRIAFAHQGQVYEINSRAISHGAKPSFVEDCKLVFGEKTTVEVDNSDAKLTPEFYGVCRFYMPLHQLSHIAYTSKQ